MVSTTSQVQPQVTTAGILGLIAGDGNLPPILAQSAREKGYRVVALALSEEALARVAPHADVHHLIAPGQLGRNLKLLQENKCTNAVFIGKVPKLNLLRSLHKLDWMGIKEVSKLPNFKDNTISTHIGNVIEGHGIKVLTQIEFLRHLFPDIGVLSSREPTAAEYADIKFGLG